MDKSLTYVEHKDKIYKEAMRRVKLLSRIRRYISDYQPIGCAVNLENNDIANPFILQ